MRQTKLKEMKLTELIEIIGLPVPLLYTIPKINAEKSFRTCYKFQTPIAKIAEFEEKLKNVKRNSFNTDELMQLIDEYDDIFDKELYALHIGILLKNENGINNQDAYVYIPNQFKEKKKKDALKFIQNKLENVDVVTIQYIRKKNDVEIKSVVSSLQFLEKKSLLEKREKVAKERLEKIEETIGLRNITDNIYPTDLLEICRYPNLGNILALKIYELAKKNNDYSSDKLRKDEFNREDLYNAVRVNMEHMNIDKLLLHAATFKYISSETRDDFSYDEFLELEEYMKKIESLMEKPGTSINFVKDNRSMKINIKLLRDSMKFIKGHFIKGIYYNLDKIDDLAENILLGDIPISTLTPEEFVNNMKYKIEGYVLLIQNQPEALEYLLSNKIINQEQLNKILNKTSIITNEQLLLLYDGNYIGKEKLLNLYQQDKVFLDNIKFLKEQSSRKDLSELVSSSELVKLYLNPDNKDEFDKYRKLYKVIKIDETADEKQKLNEAENDENKIKEIENEIIERKKAIGDEIVEQSIELLEEDKLYELYHMGLLQVDNIIDYLGSSCVSDLYKNGELKPVDAKRLYDDGIITKDMIKNILKYDNLNETEKLVLIFSTFPTNNQKDIDMRNELLLYMEDPDQSKNSKGTQNTRNQNGNGHGKNPYNKYVTDPCIRWNLISKLDKDYSQEYLKDGRIIFYLSNKEKDIIEKLFQKNNKPAYGSATYILDEELFDREKDQIVENKKINTSYLVSLYKDKTKGIAKIVHTGLRKSGKNEKKLDVLENDITKSQKINSLGGWGTAIAKFFEIDNPSKYTEKQALEIKRIIIELEKSRKKLEDASRDKI